MQQDGLISKTSCYTKEAGSERAHMVCFQLCEIPENANDRMQIRFFLDIKER